MKAENNTSVENQSGRSRIGFQAVNRSTPRIITSGHLEPRFGKNFRDCCMLHCCCELFHSSTFGNKRSALNVQKHKIFPTPENYQR